MLHDTPAHDDDTQARVTQVTPVTGSEAITPAVHLRAPFDDGNQGAVYRDARLEHEIRQLLSAGQVGAARTRARLLQGNLVQERVLQLIIQAERGTKETNLSELLQIR